jgi:hypothetical protein
MCYSTAEIDHEVRRATRVQVRFIYPMDPNTGLPVPGCVGVVQLMSGSIPNVTGQPASLVARFMRRDAGWDPVRDDADPLIDDRTRGICRAIIARRLLLADA